jgi:hypothetical protein
MRFWNILSICALALLLVVPAWAWENSDYEVSCDPLTPVAKSASS